MRKLLHRRLRLWVLMSATYAIFMTLTIAAIVTTFDLRLAVAYRNDLADQLNSALQWLENENFNGSVYGKLDKQGFHTLVFNQETGGVRYRSAGGMPLPGGDAIETNGAGQTAVEQERELLVSLIEERLGNGDGSFQVTDRETSTKAENSQGESKELFLCGRKGKMIFCLNLPMESTNAAVKIAIRFTRNVSHVAWLLCVLLFYFLSKWITRPTRIIADTAAQIAELDFSRRCPENVTRELDDLRLSINSMADSLEGHVNALREANRQLQTELAERTRQQEISAELIANLAHDLKTPIAIISGYAEGLTEGVARTPEKQQTYYDTILRESKHMQTIVSRILALGRMESGETPINPEVFDLTAMLDEILDCFQRELERLGLSLNRVGFLPCMVYTDFGCARQSLVNYIQNAVYHINGGNRIEIRLEDLGDRVRVRVLNSSAPIPENVARRLWDKLYRGDPSRQRQNGEMGLGLSIVKGNMERLGHAYGFENDPEFPGACFWLELPKAKEEPDGEEDSGDVYLNENCES